MSVLEIAVELRKGTGKGAARQTRAAKMVPGILYGEHGSNGTPIAIDANKLRLALVKRPNFLKLTGALDIPTVIVRELQRHPVTGAFEHIDLQAVHSGEKIRLTIPVHFTGTAAGVKAGGVLDVVEHHITIEVNPSEVPERVEYDITHLGLHEKLHLSQLTLPAGVKVIGDPDETLVVIHPPKHGEDKPSTEPAPMPEVITERKKEED